MVEIEKGERTKVVSQIIEWQGKMILDIRQQVLVSRGAQSSEWILTSKGIQIPASDAVAFLTKALADARNRTDEVVPMKSSKPKGLKAKIAKPTEGFLV